MIEPQRYAEDFREMRNHVLPLPTQKDGYTRVLFLGTTGAGKTTLVRQFLGTHPKNELFPSTSASKTTTVELEIILAQGAFDSVVTFLPQQQVINYVEECLLAAALAIFEEKNASKIARKLLNHEEQRFRLHYILGETPFKEKKILQQGVASDEFVVTPEEARNFATALEHYLQVLRSLVDAFREHIEQEQSEELSSEEEQDIYLQKLLEQNLCESSTFQALVEAILLAIQQRFAHFPKGAFVFGPDGWPQWWHFQSTNRREFLRTINMFSSNNSESFGKLLTPIVQGVRVSGAFQPLWRSGLPPRLVLLDGEGLGHTPETMSSLPTSVTSLFEQADVLVLVDNAIQPLQATSQVVLETVVASGYASKLFLSFTHFECVRGDNLSDRDAAEDHVRSSLDNVLGGIGKKVNVYDKQTLKRQLEGNVFLLSHLDKVLISETQTLPGEPTISEARDELCRLLATIEAVQPPSSSEELRPIYNERSLFAFLQKAVRAFRGHWQGRLGLIVSPDVQKEHWRKVEALARCVVGRQANEYKTLRPAADLIKEVSEQVRQFLVQPARWEPFSGTEEMRHAVIDAIARELYTRLHVLIQRRIITEHPAEWAVALARSGRGSAKVRAEDIDAIYCAAAPTLEEIVRTMEREKMYLSGIPTLSEIVEESQGDAFTT